MMLAMRSKSLSKCRTVSPASSAVAAMVRSGTDGARCWPRSGEQGEDFDGPVLDRWGEVFHRHRGDGRLAQPGPQVLL